MVVIHCTIIFLFVQFRVSHKPTSKCRFASARRKVTLKKDYFFHLRTQFFNQVTGGISPSGVRSTYTSKAAVMLFTTFEFDGYASIANRNVKDWGTLVGRGPGPKYFDRNFL